MKRIMLAMLVLGSVLAGCGGEEGSPAAGGEPRTLTVLAAASLTEAFGTLERQFETANPGVDVRYSFAGSSDLSSQIVGGAPADVFASANQKQMTKVVDAGLAAGQPQLFATNTLTIAVPPANPARIGSFEALADPALRLVVCAPQVPCGAATEEVEAATGVVLAADSEEQDVKDVLAKVQAGEADAGLVYVTDVRTARPPVESVAFPGANSAVNEYPIAALRDAPNPELARSFVDFVRGPQGRAALGGVGFGTP